MALSHLLQPKSNLRICRLSFSTARAGFFTSFFSKNDSHNLPGRKKEAATEETGIVAVEAVEQSKKESSGKSSGFFSKETPIVDSMASTDSKRLSALFSEHKDDQTTTIVSSGKSSGFFSKETHVVDSMASTDSKRLSGLFIEHKDDQTTTTVEKEGRKSEASLSNLLDFLDGPSFVEDKEASNLEDKCPNLKDLKECLKIPIPTNNEDQRQRQKTSSANTELLENRVLISFLRGNVSENQLLDIFSSCGQILKVQVPYSTGPQLKTAYIDFKNRKGFEQALKRSGLTIANCPIVVESASLTEKNSVKTPIPPALLGDPDIPPELVKNPTRTIKIENLPKEISSHHIEEALAFCKSNISGYSLGSSHSVAYVEFETEIGKERALAKQSIEVLGRRLVILRVDCPRTTVVRISMDHVNLKNLIPICRSLGGVGVPVQRGPGVLDVHFKVSEWPNMVKILNSLNGSIVDGKRLLAEPAPIFPPEILLALWHHPEERRRLQDTVQAMVKKFTDVNTLHTAELASLERFVSYVRFYP